MVDERFEENVKIRAPKDNFIDRLQQASGEIDSIKTSFSKGMEELSRIQSMLSVDGITKMSTMIQSFEEQLSDAERRRDEASEGARRYSQELDKEKERLVKLWDAYKSQEENLAASERHTAELETQLHDVQQRGSSFERDANARLQTLTHKLEEQQQSAMQVEELRQQALKFDTIRHQLEENVEGMRRECITKDDVIRSLERQVNDLKGLEQFAGFKAKFEDTSAELEKEKERLTKLFRLYEETEEENKELKSEVMKWQEWFAANEDLFTRLTSSVETLKQKRTSTPVDTQPELTELETPTVHEPSAPEPETKHKHRIHFRK
jgi:chromosome segregation ATPase